MKKFICLAFLLLSFSLISFAQMDTTKLINENAIYLEFEGESATILSVHWDKILFRHSKSFTTLNIGAGFMSKGNYPSAIVGIPIGISWNSGIKSHHFEFGLGLVFYHGLNRDGDNSIYNFSRIGYRYQSPKNPIFFRIGILPEFRIIDITGITGPVFFPTLGLSLGYCL